MIKYQHTTIKHNTPAQKIDMLRTMDKMNASLDRSTLAIEKDQIESIRAMTQYLLLEETDSTVTF
jgi:flagellin-specific chaperone FliS